MKCLIKGMGVEEFDCGLLPAKWLMLSRLLPILRRKPTWPPERQLSPDEQQECKNKEEHEEHLKQILELLKKEELYAKFSKCEFWIPKVQFLGHVIDSEGIHVDRAKIESIKD
ncbi:hypothetical protein Tco_0642153 [Tanacetum coccineum]